MRDMTEFEKLVSAAFKDCMTDPIASAFGAFGGKDSGKQFESLMMQIDCRLRAIENHPALSIPPLEQAPPDSAA